MDALAKVAGPAKPDIKSVTVISQNASNAKLLAEPAKATPFDSGGAIVWLPVVTSLAQQTQSSMLPLLHLQGDSEIESGILWPSAR